MGQYSMQQALQQFIQKSKNKQAFQAIQIEAVWETLMGKTVARYTDKIQIQGTKLFITTSVAPLKQELSYQKRQIIERVNEVLGDRVIDEVVIR
jgi:G:T/U-mismatch repair DNA glycosylase